jgi:hypothetical protein
MIHQSLEYLVKLELVLQKQQQYWNFPPTKGPPNYSFDSSADKSSSGHVQSAASVASTAPWIDSNPFAFIQLEDDDKEDDDDEEEMTSLDPDMQEAGDQPLLHQMSMRRLLIRILTSQAEIISLLASNWRERELWKLCVDHCSVSVKKIHDALYLADSEISLCLDSQESSVAREELVQDASIVEVAVNHLVEELGRSKQQMKSQKSRLLRFLRPQWSSRDQVKAKMGARWYNNPEPKRDFVVQREEEERKLKELDEALSRLEQLDVEGLQAFSQNLCGRLGHHSYHHKTHRYNGIRPDYSRRLPFDRYPDATEFGWIFTGSEGDKVDFFEKGFSDGKDTQNSVLVKLDWYFTTGTIKTSMYHPRQGKTQLFASGEQVSPELFIQILMDPRTHTNVRYQTRGGRDHRGSGRRGRGGRGRGRGRGRAGSDISDVNLQRVLSSPNPWI